MEKVANRLREMVGPIDLIVCSPYARARQTADIIGRAYDRSGIQEAPELVPHAPVASFVSWLKAHALEKRCVVVVGHEPHLSNLATFLVCGRNESLFEFKKAAVMSLDISDIEGVGPRCAIVEWLVPPKILTSF